MEALVMPVNKKIFHLECQICGDATISMRQWINSRQMCPNCGSDYALVIYEELEDRLVKIFSRPENNFRGMWKYFDVLPLEDKNNIITAQEGDVAVERWPFLERYAYEFYDLVIRVYAHRQDNNNATGSFKDLAGSMIASVLQENNIQDYVVASTGNIGVAFARYLAAYGANLYAFIPENAPSFKEAEIAIFGQTVYRVKGDYTYAKHLANRFAEKRGFLNANGRIDPLRVEAKKTMAFDWFLHTEDFPSVYIQALSGGTGAIGVHKGCEELLRANLISKHPRHILVQSNGCAPMAKAWAEAELAGFPKDWTNEFPVIENPDTLIPTLGTGNPSAYPMLAPLVRDTGGTIIDFDETKAADVARVVAFESSVRIGPAAAIGVGGFFSALSHNDLSSGDVVLINVGEGIRRDPDFMLHIPLDRKVINNISDCQISTKSHYRSSIWSLLDN
jgi:threonine synthase